MAASSTTDDVSSSASEIRVSQEEFFAFHNIDRQLFLILVFNLRREPSEAMQVIAFWIWLERIYSSRSVSILLTYPNPIIEAVFEETVNAIRVAESEEFHLPYDTYDIPILQNIVGKRVSLRYFHENRIEVLIGVGKIVQQVCFRAFKDLILMISQYRALSNNYNYYQYPNHSLNNNNNVASVNNLNKSYNPNVASSSNLNNNKITSTQEDEIIEILARMRMGDNLPSQEVVVLPPGERTIFLTFSKGYPITEPELRDFLYRSFGDVIETLYMQDVSESEQPLYARLVVRDANAMQVILSVQGKAKFAINGKHVWARKYVRKNPNSPPSSPTNGNVV